MNDRQPENIHQEKLEAILANAVDAIVTIDEDGIIESANPATERMFGYPVSEVVGRDVKMLMPQPDRDLHGKYIRNYLDTGIKKIIGIGREVVGQRKDGSTFPIHLAVSEILIGNRRLFTGIVRDISDVKAAEQKLEQINEELEERVKLRTEELKQAQADLIRSEKLATLGHVSGGIAHEIRNPLNAVKTSAYYLSHAKNPSEEKVREHLERIDRQVNVIDNVITALSDVAKLPEADLRPVNIEKLLRDIVGTTTLPSDIQIEYQFADTLPPALVDENQMPIAFRNLVRNARDAMPNGGKLIVGARFLEPRIEVFVLDDGVGIPSENLDRILEPLFTTKARGMGLGLPITMAVVKKNQCELTVESEEGQGSRFSIHVNVVEEDAKNSESSDSEPAGEQ